eukprot:gene7769-955_t
MLLLLLLLLLLSPSPTWSDCGIQFPWIEPAVKQHSVRMLRSAKQSIQKSNEEALAKLMKIRWGKYHPGMEQVTLYLNNSGSVAINVTRISPPNQPYKPVGIIRVLERAVEKHNQELAQLMGNKGNMTFIFQTEDQPTTFAHLNYKLPLFSMCTEEGTIDLPVPDFTFDNYPEAGYAKTGFWDILELLKIKSHMIPWRTREPHVFMRHFAGGNAYSAALKYKLACASVVFMFESPYREFFYPALVPDVHYVSLPEVTSAELRKDVFPRIKVLIKTFQREYALMSPPLATAARDFIVNQLTPDAVSCYWLKLLVAYSRLWYAADSSVETFRTAYVEYHCRTNAIPQTWSTTAVPQLYHRCGVPLPYKCRTTDMEYNCCTTVVPQNGVLQQYHCRTTDMEYYCCTTVVPHSGSYSTRVLA